FFQAEDGIRDFHVTGVQTCALPISAARAQEPATAMNGVLVGPNQMTLYVFDKDAAGSGKSVCNGGCAANWPPLMASGEAAATGRSEERRVGKEGRSREARGQRDRRD